MDLLEVLKKALSDADINPYSIQSEYDLNDKLKKFKSELAQELTFRNHCEYKDFKIVINTKEEQDCKRYRITIYLLSKQLQNRYKNNGATIEFSVG